MATGINYGNKMHRAMRGLISEVLEEVGRDGLPGEHHFFITFDTGHPDVGMADWLFDRYPQEMTIVIQHWFDGLVVAPDGFQITLNFGDNPEPLSIPFDAIRTFVDPSVEFGLRFESNDEAPSKEGTAAITQIPDLEEVLEDALVAPDDDAQSQPKQSSAQDAEVVSLDSFRKT